MSRRVLININDALFSVVEYGYVLADLAVVLFMTHFLELVPVDIDLVRLVSLERQGHKVRLCCLLLIFVADADEGTSSFLHVLSTW